MVRPTARGRFFDVYCVPSATPAPTTLDSAVPSRIPVGQTPVVGPRDIQQEVQATPPYSRLGLVVPKRVCRSAARRNWIKRMVRESFRREMPATMPIDCIVRLRCTPEASNAAAAREELSRHWRKVTV